MGEGEEGAHEDTKARRGRGGKREREGERSREDTLGFVGERVD